MYLKIIKKFEHINQFQPIKYKIYLFLSKPTIATHSNNIFNSIY